jgi:hypothetical protein
VLLLPGRSPARPLEAASQRFDVLVLPTAGAALALLGERGEPLEALGRRLSPRP